MVEVYWPMAKKRELIIRRVYIGVYSVAVEASKI